MNISVELVKKEEKETLRNLLEKWDYEFSQYDDRDVNNLGLYSYDYFENCWTEENRFPFFIKVDNKLAGFIIIYKGRQIKNINSDYSIDDFFVMYKYRKQGIGKYVVKYILNKYKGKWQFKYHPKNEISKIFWNKIIGEYTNGKYDIIKDNPESIYEDGTLGHVLIFET
jgi:predicted acetyltransferase